MKVFLECDISRRSRKRALFLAVDHKNHRPPVAFDRASESFEVEDGDVVVISGRHV
jgi:hypothetical protein